jgi:hypothetical protein
MFLRTGKKFKLETGETYDELVNHEINRHTTSDNFSELKSLEELPNNYN